MVIPRNRLVPSMIVADCIGGDSINFVSLSKAFTIAALFVFLIMPNASARLQGNGTSGKEKTTFRSISLLWPMIGILPVFDQL